MWIGGLSDGLPTLPDAWLYCRMRKRSRILEAKRLSLLEIERKMTPEQRLEAYVQHSRLVMEIYHAGVKDRETVGSRLGKR